ncbi:MAG: hypothetical protein M1840_006663 [Geoglossum simile]|nr:MAG: hypothetical protein M1840_006663 [Geoglossum simile]
MPLPTKTARKKLIQNCASRKFRHEEKEFYVRYLEEHVYLPEKQLDTMAKPINNTYRQLKLTEENQELKEALLRMRKKLESFNNQAKSVADNPIAIKILNENEISLQNS